MSRVRVSASYLASPPTLNDRDASPLLCDPTGRLLVATGASETAPTLLTSSEINGAFLVSAAGALRVLSIVGSNGNLFEDGIAAYLNLYNVAYPGPGPLPAVTAPAISLGSSTPVLAGRDILGPQGMLFELGCLFAWSASPVANVPFLGEGPPYKMRASFQFTVGS